ncbi:cobalamin-independent methionine synthase [Dietzia sp. B32]|uniref:cobalamin-independent methionine synthase n=1 Tax=Dietzia sp. B32 TaxID=2915130 RepID=UPI0021ADEF91|nr:cobalamin-independent methionine synthase [Dietzia sp. B32]UVE95714.1 cobalamin-independent methionine synthase [Dietzia sp. B32]
MTPVAPAGTGPGPMPGTDPRESARVVMGECHALPFLPELPERGPGADQIGRTLALLADLPVDVSPRGWRLADAPGRLARRATDFLDRDADALEEADEQARDPEADPSPGSRRLQVRVVGPWSLAAGIELPGGMPVLSDRGARRDLAASLAEGASARAAQLARRIGAGARIVLDEPLLWHVAAGTVHSPSRFDPIAAVPPDRLAVSLCRFGDALRRAGAAEVLIRVPVISDPGAPPAWSVVTETPRDETPLDGVCLTAAPLYSAQSHDALDAAGTVLGNGGILHLEGLPGAARPPRTTAEAEQTAVSLLALLDRLSAPRYSSLGRVVLSLTPEETTSGAAQATAALRGARLVAETAPRVAE